MDKRDRLADEAFETFNFGDGVTVEASNGWDADDDDWNKVVFVSFDDDAADADSHKVSLHVRFEEESDVIAEVYALLCRTGGMIGAAA